MTDPDKEIKPKLRGNITVLTDQAEYRSVFPVIVSDGDTTGTHGKEREKNPEKKTEIFQFSSGECIRTRNRNDILFRFNQQL